MSHEKASLVLVSNGHPCKVPLQGAACERYNLTSCVKLIRRMRENIKGPGGGGAGEAVVTCYLPSCQAVFVHDPDEMEVE